MEKDIQTKLETDFKNDLNFAYSISEDFLKSSRESIRTTRCLVFLANGDLSMLKKLVKQGRCDYRDIIFWAEYVNHSGSKPKRVRDFNKPFGKHNLISDQPVISLDFL